MPFGAQTWAATTTLNISGPTAAELPLTMQAPLPSSGFLNLVLPGPPAASMPLFIGKDVDSSGNMPLFLQSPINTGDPSAVLHQDITPLTLIGTAFNTSDGFGSADLFLSTVLIASGIGTAPLTLITDPPPTPNPDGSISSSGDMTLVMGAANPSGVRVKSENQTSLFIKTHSSGNNTMTLYLDYPLGQVMPLSIKNKSPSGVLDVSISGAYFANDSTTLNIHAPVTDTMTLVSRGFDGSGEAPLSI